MNEEEEEEDEPASLPMAPPPLPVHPVVTKNTLDYFGARRILKQPSESELPVQTTLFVMPIEKLEDDHVTCNTSIRLNVTHLGYLGEGTYGAVYKSKSTSASEREYAEKCTRLTAHVDPKSPVLLDDVKNALLNFKQYRAVFMEVNVLNKLKGEGNVLQLAYEGVYFAFYDTALYVCIGVELGLMDLATYIELQRPVVRDHIATSNTGEFSLCDGAKLEYYKQWVDTRGNIHLVTAEIMAGIMRGLAHLHAKRILHRDIKPNNIILFQDGTAKLSDFGLAKSLPADGQIESVRNWRPYATGFQPYECVCRKSYGRPADVWAAGCVYVCLIMDDADFMYNLVDHWKVRMDQDGTYMPELNLEKEDDMYKFQSYYMPDAYANIFNPVYGELPNELREYCSNNDVVKRIMRAFFSRRPECRSTAADLADMFDKEVRSYCEGVAHAASTM